MKIANKREQRQACLSFAEREQFAPKGKITNKREQSPGLPEALPNGSHLHEVNLHAAKKLTLLLFVFLLGLYAVSWAQTKEITGTVTSVSDGNTIPGVSVFIKGTTLGTITDVSGNYRLRVPQDAKTLVFSFVGMQTKEVDITGNTINTQLQSELVGISEVVVTALGITRERKSLGYAVQDVSGHVMLQSRGGLSNPINSLAGRVSGLQVTGSSGNMGGSSKLLIRGVKSLSGNNQPLFVIDGVPIEGTDFNVNDYTYPYETARGAGGYDYGNLIQDINPDDIQSISVLKGPNASALYGSRAMNGVIMITTKRGGKGSGLGVAFNSSLGFEAVNKMPKLQNQYGGGFGFSTANINGTDFNIIDYAIDESWGPEYDGTTQYLSWYDLAKWEAGGKQGNPTTSTWQAPKHDVKDFFETGRSLTNNITITQGSENVAMRISYTNSILRGYVPNSKLDKNSLNLSGTLKSNDLYEVFANITYLNQKAKGRPETGYGDNSVMQKFIQWGHRQLDMKELKALYKMPDGTQATWNRSDWDDPTPAYSNNPYWTVNMNYQNDTRDRLYGNIGVKVNIMDNLSARYTLNLDYFSDKRYERNAVGSQEQSRYQEIDRQQHEINHEFMFTYDKTFGDFSLVARAGANLMYQKHTRLIGESVGGLVLPEFYNLNNSVLQAKSSNYLREKAINSIFASASLDYQSYVFLDLTLRNDWSSTLPKSNRSYLYPSITGSFIFSQLTKDLSWLNFGKLRLGWAQVGNDTDPYRILDTYTFYTGFGGDHAYVLPYSKNNSELKPEQTNSYEAGLEMNFLDNRVGFDFTAYYSETENQILPLSLSGTTGYTSQIINAGLITNKGIELSVFGVPVKNNDFEWRVTGTLSSNKNKVKELLADVDYYRLVNAPFRVEVGAFVGKAYGVIMGTDYVYHENGKRIVTDGFYDSTGENVPLGSVFPKVMFGITNAFRYKNFDFSFLFDGQFGAKFFSTSYMFGTYTGMLEETAGLNELGNKKRDPVAGNGGVLLDGVNADGTPNETRIETIDWGSSLYSGPAAQSVLKSDFVKLREVTIGYTVPLKSNIVKNLLISAYGRNLLLFGPDTKHFDPESAITNSGNIQGIEGAALPSVATFGLNVGLQF